VLERERERERKGILYKLSNYDNTPFKFHFKLTKKIIFCHAQCYQNTKLINLRFPKCLEPVSEERF
jgi:hypothetical protein